MAAPLLEARGLSRPGLLQVAHLSLQAGELLAISGPSGAGKSLLLRALVDLDPAEGEVFLSSLARSAQAAPAWRRQVAYVPAESGWWESDVGSHFSDPKAAAAWLPRLHLSEGAMDWSLQRLSTGERQRLALLRALLAKPKVLLLDEPTSALDDAAEAAVETLLSEFISAGGGIILVTHDTSQAARLATRSRRLEAGRLLDETPA
ncbi:MAG: ATP-binding cassette domain-containing protein [Pseudomonadota bacterium]